MRKTILDRTIAEFPREVQIIISTKAPDKWVFIDTETGNVWAWDIGRPHLGHFRRANSEECKEAAAVLERRKNDRQS
uniref:Uncharacterized protein n=1 Tax=viral metagenome TaxID=1070528 RepID=A0A6H1ZWU1_9ZZZZ